jgi:Ohr subfamily peroxiredoxin
VTINVKYSTTATAIGGREGHAFTQDKALDLKLTTPKELGGAGGAGTNPEQLFAAGYAACFLSALKLVAQQRNVVLSEEASISATVGIGPNGDGGFGLAVELVATLPDLDPAVAEQLVAEAHLVCPYSDATRNNIDVHPSVA